MPFLIELKTQIRNLWSRWSKSQRTMIVAAFAVSIGLLVLVGSWGMSPQYVAVADHLAPTQTADAVSALEAAGIDYKLNFAGSAISVPVSQHSQARLALGEIIGTSELEDESTSSSIWSDPLQNRERMLRQQEERLARTISQMKPVKSAIVHITRPESSPFVRDQAPAKASVTIEFQPGTPFSGSDTAAVVSLVAHSVERLLPENVTVLSTDGRLLSTPNGMQADVTGQLEYRTILEANLAAKAENLLAPLLGLGNATVRVSADIDFTETERTQKTIDAESKGKIKEEIHKESYQGESPIALGPPGTTSNVPNGSPNANGSRSGDHESEDVMTEYVNGETTNLIRERPGQIRRLTIAAVVQLPQDAAAAPNAAATGNPTSALGGNATSSTINQQSIESIIKNAVGFDETRGDEIQVVVAELTGVPILAPPVTWPDRINDFVPLVKAISLGLAAMSALILSLLILKRLRPVVVERSLQDSLTPEIVAQLNELSQQMKDNPEVVTTVMATWLKDKQQSDEPRRRAA